MPWTFLPDERFLGGSGPLDPMVEKTVLRSRGEGQKVEVGLEAGEVTCLQFHAIFFFLVKLRSN